MNRRVLIALGAILIVAAGALYYFKFRPASAQAQPDPAVQIAFALGALERSDSHRLTTDQIKTILPLLRVLRDTDPNDVEASSALARSIRELLTPDQIAEIDRMRAAARARREQGGPQPGGPGSPPGGPGFGGPGFGPGGPGPGFGPGGPGVGPGGNPQSRAQFRARARQVLLSRLIRRLEQRL